MEGTEYKLIQDLLYEEDGDLVKGELTKIDNSLLLHIFAANYNWDNGFDIPNSIINNESCDLGTALFMFYSADGYRMLEDQQAFNLSKLNNWKVFLINLYEKVNNNSFKRGNIAFGPPLTKIQIFKLKKKNKDIPNMFLDTLEGNKVNIPKL